MISTNDIVTDKLSVFEQMWWLDAVAPNQWDSIIIRDKLDKCIGRLPYMKTNLWGMPVFGMPAFTQHIGPWFDISDNMKMVTKLKRIKHISEQFIESLNGNNVDLYFHNSFSYLLPFIWVGYNIEPKYTYVIDSLRSIEMVYKGFDAKLRNTLKNAETKYFITSHVSVDQLINFVRNTFQKQSRSITTMGEAVIRRLYDASMQHNACKVIGAVDKETKKMVSVAFFVYDSKTCYYLIGGKDYSLNAAGSQELLIWEGIKFADSLSLEFDFEGSMIPGIESFFRGFGGTPKVYYRVWKGNVLFSIMQKLKPFVKRLVGYK